MSTKYLDPTLDVVFKLMLVREPALLHDMIRAVLGPLVPIDRIVVLNPNVEKELPADKEIVLDLRLRLSNGHQVDLEMQSANPPGTRDRFLFYAARMLAGSLKAGGAYTSLLPTISILWLKQPLLQVPAFHSVFHFSGDRSREIFSSLIELHVLELPHLHLAAPERQAKLERWARFLRAQSPEELEALAREDPIMSTARSTLERLSSEPDIQLLAEQRAMAQIAWQHTMASALEEGEAKGVAKGRAEGEAKGRAEGEAKERRRSVRYFCELLGIEFDDQKQRVLESSSLEQLAELQQRLVSERKWPDGF